MVSAFLDSVAINRIGDNAFETVQNPGRMGNNAPIAYGGCTISAALNAAQVELPSGFYLYSAMGNYLGPALPDRKLRCVVRALRKTRTFITKQVDVSQVQGDGSYRSCLIMLADFHAAEKASMLTYSKPPKMSYTPAENVPTIEQQLDALVAAGEMSTKQVRERQVMLALAAAYFEQRYPPESTNAHTQLIMARTKSTPQDHLPPTDKTLATWFKTKEKLQSPAEQVLAMAWYLDAALPFAPLCHNKMWLDDASACGSLDFALRILANDFDLNAWHLWEVRSIAAGEGRTFSEAHVRDQKGKMIASMTQQCILRPPSATSKL